ncbi:hypothetical protein DPM33_26995 [Mesorhizobium hawassense]|uniref:Uncharacterized protein n=1 Tax=Mesorhizobium hawassense TaxID=1209954 RepID=A0A330HE55_9HYPH|nr:hypothetical protein DPM33_26995 [Mesorhizobium hawassense]
MFIETIVAKAKMACGCRYWVEGLAATDALDLGNPAAAALKAHLATLFEILDVPVRELRLVTHTRYSQLDEWSLISDFTKIGRTSGWFGRAARVPKMRPLLLTIN